MKLPNGGNAIIDSRKLSEYCLNPDHDDGQHKADQFRRLVGVTIENADLLIEALRRAAADGEATPGRRDGYGQRYVIDFGFTGPTATATVRSAWIIRTDELTPRLVTCYIL